jgi:hypothetical protein
MHDTQVKPRTQSDDQGFRPTARANVRVGAKHRWPVQVGDGPHVLLKRRTSPLHGSNEQPSTSDFVLRRPTALQQFFASFSLERSFTLLGFTVAVFEISLFGLDLALGWPFRHASLLFDATSSICGALLLLLCWDVFREQVKGFTR